MPAFLSHSSKDVAVYSALCLAFDGANVARWDPETMAPGASLADQLRRAISGCEICVFVATRNSTESSWCLAEVGAFWGSAKTVIIYLADPDLAETVLPPQFRGDLMARNARDLIAAVRSTVESRARMGIETHQPQFFASPGDFGGENDWLTLLKNTNECCEIMGLSMLSWRQTRGFPQALLDRAAHGCKIRILLMHQDNPVLPLQASDLEMLRVDIPRNFEFFQRLADQNSNIEVRQLRDGLMYFLMMRTDQYAVVLQFLSSQMWGKGPLWKCVRESALYKTASEEFNTLWIQAGGHGGQIIESRRAEV